MLSFAKALLLVLWGIALEVHSFTFLKYGSSPSCLTTPRSNSLVRLSMTSSNSTNDNEEGAQLAAELFKTIQARGMQLDEDMENEDLDEEDEEEAPNIPQGAINAFLGYETNDGAGEKLSGNVSLTDNELYSAVKERVLDTAGGFVDFVRQANEDDEDEEEEEPSTTTTTTVYEPPVTIPDPELTAGEVIMVVLQALLHNNVPSPNRGVEILFGFSSPHSQIKNDNTLTPAEYADFLQETEYKVLFANNGQKPKIDKADYSTDGKRAFFTARLVDSDAGGGSPVSVNFILSTTHGVEEDSCWLIDSMLIRPQSMRRRRRR